LIRVDNDTLIHKYFTNLTVTQKKQFSEMGKLYKDWNEKINVISRKDIDHLYERHVVHSLAIAKLILFKKDTKILDVGTGGGFPGIPLAILFPEVHFHLIDSTGKKVKVVQSIIDALELHNVKAEQVRAEYVVEKYDFVISRAVRKMKLFYGWINDRISNKSFNKLKNGILCLKGGNVTEEMKELNKPYEVFELKDYYEEAFFETKKVIYLPN